MSGRQPLLLLLGAGFSSTFQIATTEDVTRELTLAFGGDDTRANSVSNALKAGDQIPSEATALDVLRGATLAAGYQPTFESDINNLETLISIVGYGYEGKKPCNRLAVADILHVTSKMRELTSFVGLERMLDNSISRVISAIDTSFDRNRAAAIERTRAYFSALSEHFDLIIHNLNYDPIIDETVPNSNDGFILGGEFARFDIRYFLDAGGTRLAHAHGSTRFRMFPKEGQPGPFEVIKFSGTPPLGYPWYRAAKTQAGDFSLISCIVTGLRKAEKTRFEPYGTYSATFDQDLLRCPRILMIGYGGSDIYLSQQLIRAKRYHSRDARIVAITSGLPEADKPRTDWMLLALLAGNDYGYVHELAKGLPERGLARWGDIAIDAGGFRPEDEEQTTRTIEWLG